MKSALSAVMLLLLLSGVVLAQRPYAPPRPYMPCVYGGCAYAPPVIYHNYNYGYGYGRGRGWYPAASTAIGTTVGVIVGGAINRSIENRNAKQQRDPLEQERLEIERLKLEKQRVELEQELARIKARQP